MRFREDELIFKVTDPGDNKPAAAGLTKRKLNLNMIIRK